MIGGDAIPKSVVGFLGNLLELREAAKERQDQSFPAIDDSFLITLGELIEEQEEYKKVLKKVKKTLQKFPKKERRKQLKEWKTEQGDAEQAIKEEFGKLKQNPNWGQFVTVKDRFNLDRGLGKWAMDRYIEGGIKRFEDIKTRLEPAIADYNKLKKMRLVGKQKINRFDGLESLEAFIHQDRFEDAMKRDRRMERMKEEEVVLLHDGSDFKLFQPLSLQASCYLGRGTKWCTAATRAKLVDEFVDSSGSMWKKRTEVTILSLDEENETAYVVEKDGDRKANIPLKLLDWPNRFEDYHKDGPLYIIQPKNPKYEGEKYQLHFESRQVMDKKDLPVPLSTLQERFPNLLEIIFGQDRYQPKTVELKEEIDGETVSITFHLLPEQGFYRTDDDEKWKLYDDNFDEYSLLFWKRYMSPEYSDHIQGLAEFLADEGYGYYYNRHGNIGVILSEDGAVETLLGEIAADPENFGLSDDPSEEALWNYLDTQFPEDYRAIIELPMDNYPDEELKYEIMDQVRDFLKEREEL